MPSSKSYIALGLLALAAPSFSTPVAAAVFDNNNIVLNKQNSPSSASPLRDMFSSMLALADPPSLHEALHASHPKYADGTFETDQTALQAVHQESPALATKILELARRQGPGSGTGTGTGSGSAGSSSNSSVTTPAAPPPSPSSSPSQTPPQPTTPTASPPTTPSTTLVLVTSTATPPAVSTPASTPPRDTTVTVLSTSIAQVPVTTSAQVAPPPSTSSPAAQAPQQQTTQPPADVPVSSSAVVDVFTPADGSPPSTYTTYVFATGMAQGNSAQSPGAADKSGTLRDAAGVLRPEPYVAGVAGLCAAFVMGMVA